MSWPIHFEEEFELEYGEMSPELQDELLAQLTVLQQFGPGLGRPRADTLNGSTYPNMKELRFNHAGGVWRVAFAFDPARTGIVLVAGDKGGADQKRFYKQLIATADRRFASHLKKLNEKGEKPK